MLIGLLLAVFCLLLWLTGYAIASIISRLSPIAPGDQAILAFPLGAASIGWLIFCANAALQIPINSLLIRSLLLSFGALGAVLLFYEVRNRSGLESGKDTIRFSYYGLSSYRPFFWIELGLLTILLARFIIEYLTVPVMHVDAFTYYLPYAQIIYDTYDLPQFVSVSEIDHEFAFPPLQFLFIATTWLWLGEVHVLLPHLFPLIIAIHLSVLIYRAVRKLFQTTPEAALGAVLLFLLPGIVMRLITPFRMSMAILIAFWCMAAIYFLSLDLCDKQAKRWIWIGIFGAFACWTKMNANILGPACVGVLCLEWAIRRISRKTTTYNLIDIGKLAVVWIAVLMPLLLRSWILWDNPFYPAMANIFGGYLIDELSLSYLPIFNSHAPFAAWRHILSAIATEPVVGLSIFLILHPMIRKHIIPRTIWMINLSILFAFLFLVEAPYGDKTYPRYMLPFTTLLILLMARFLDERKIRKDSWDFWVFSGAFFIQLYSVFVEKELISLTKSVNDLKVFMYDYSAFLITGLFAITALFPPQWNLYSVRIRQWWLIGCATLLIFMFPISRPWEYFSKPLNRPPVDWRLAPLIQPYGPWMDARLPDHAVILTKESRRWMVPRQVFPADSPLLVPYIMDHTDDLVPIIERLAELGVTHILTLGYGGEASPLRIARGVSPWQFLSYPESDAYFKQVYRGLPVGPSKDPRGYTESESYIYEIKYPKSLKDVVTSDASRPWLHRFATMGKPFPSVPGTRVHE